MPTHVVSRLICIDLVLARGWETTYLLCWYHRRDYYLCLQSLSVSSILTPLFVMAATLQSKRLWSVLKSANVPFSMIFSFSKIGSMLLWSTAAHIVVTVTPTPTGNCLRFLLQRASC